MLNFSVLLLGASSSIHMQRWANGLAERGVCVHLASIDAKYKRMNPNIVFHSLPISSFWGYFGNTLPLRRLLQHIKPDLLNVHYASGYGLLARLTGFHPTLFSVWGSDVFIFPNKSWLHHKILCDNLLFSDEIASTSNSMGEQVQYLIGNKKKIYITPFGVDCTIFTPLLKEKNNEIVIGTVKRLEATYGIDILIRSVALLKKKISLYLPELADRLRLKIVGSGADKASLKKLASKLGIDGIVEFIGAVPHMEVPIWLNKFDIYVALSRSESFGVAILEASACGVPVVVSDVGGLPEVVVNELTGFIVQSENINDASDAIERLVVNKDLRNYMGSEGRNWVMKHYSWEKSIDQMLFVYQDVINNRR